MLGEEESWEFANLMVLRLYHHGAFLQKEQKMSRQELVSLSETTAPLYAAAIRFRALACWEWMHDSDLFGVQDPESGEIGYCCVMGNLGEHYALAVYLGAEGLEGLNFINETFGRATPQEVLLRQCCLMLSFEDREMLDTRDRQTIKQLGLKFRGRQEWPQFRSYRPGYLPWHLMPDEERFLTVAIEQAMEVALRFKDDRGLLAPGRRSARRFLRSPREFLVRVPKRIEAGWAWEDTYAAPAPLKKAAVPEAPLDQERLQRITESAAPTDGVLEIAWFYGPSGVKGEGDARPYFPAIILTVDQASGFIFDTQIVAPTERAASIVEAVLHLTEEMGRLPGEIQVSQEETLTLLKPVTAALGIRLRSVRRLKSLDAARDELFSFLALRG